MQRLNALRVDTRALAAPTVERGHLLDSPISHDERLEATRKRALLGHFGTAKAVSRASIPDLLAVPGVSAQMAQAIYDFFHERSE